MGLQKAALTVAWTMLVLVGGRGARAAEIAVHVPENLGYVATVFSSTSNKYPEVVQGAAEATMVKCYDATSLHRNYGEAQGVTGSMAAKALVGNGGDIMMFGAYDKLEAGQYVVIYRVQELEKVEGEKLCFLDVCSGRVTVAGMRPGAGEFAKGQWSTIPVSVKLAEAKTVEYRFWPEGHRAAVDQVYVFKLKMKESTAGAKPVRAASNGKPAPVRPVIPGVPSPAGRGTVSDGGSTETTSATGAFAITVPSAPATGSAVESGVVQDAHEIERAGYENAPKRLQRNIASVTAMTVAAGTDGMEYGQTSEILATVDPDSRRSGQAGVGFFRPDGDDMMKTAFAEAVRAVRMRYPIWEPGHIDISFGEKFNMHAGPSAGTAFGLLMLSVLEGFEIDPKCAITGDVSVDWKVRNVGGIEAKVRGAALDKCLYAAIPEGNQAALPDMTLLDGESALWNIQVFGLGDLQDAVAVARRDRAAALGAAIKEFAALQAEEAKEGTAAMHTTEAQRALAHVLQLAPNHLSAKYLLEIARGNGSQELSLAGSEYYTLRVLSQYQGVLTQAAAVGRLVLPPHFTEAMRKQLDLLRPIISKPLKPLFVDVSLLVSETQNLAEGRGEMAALRARIASIQSRLAEVAMDRDVMEKMIREGY